MEEGRMARIGRQRCRIGGSDMMTSQQQSDRLRHRRPLNGHISAVVERKRSVHSGATKKGATISARDLMQMSSAAIFLLSFLPLLHIANGRCYLPESGLTLTGHDYRRFNDFDEVIGCARECLSDCACMGFVWFKNGTCTLKSLSLDSGVSASVDARFGLCVNEDYDGRDRLWDHEFTGDDVKIHMKVHRDDCAEMCLKDEDASTLYSWTPNRLSSLIGMCRCKGRMTGVRLRFGATCGFLDRK